MSGPALVFLPWVARGGAIALPPDPVGGHPASRVSSIAEITLNGTARASIPVLLMGPGDVVGLVHQQVIRTEPAAGARTFESNYLAAIEFDEPALPWLFTPASANAGKLRPWLCLVVVKAGPGVRLDVPGTGTLPVLRIAAPALPEEELPDLADSWAWAHGQIAPQGSESFVDALGTDPARNLSRLVCGRLLAAQTEYLACVVPAFEAGRLAGLGQDPGGAEGPAWARAAGMKPVELPVYHHWRFATGPSGDFQSLALKIRGRTPEAGFGSRPIDVSKAGVGLAGTEAAQVRLGGALRPLATAPAAWSAPALAPRFAASLTAILNAPDSAPASDPLLAPPRYGAAYRRGTAALGPAGSAGWYEQLNANPANRMPAALGVRIVQRDQEVLVASAWDQAADMRAATALGRLADAGLAIAQRFHRRHLEPLAAEAGVFVVAPLLRRLAPLGAPGGGGALAAMIGGGGFTAQGLSPAIRRATRIRGPALRRALRAPGGPPTLGLATRAAAIAGPRRARIDVGPLGGLMVLGTATPSALDGAWDVIRVEPFGAAPRRPGFAIRPPDLQGSGPRPEVVDPIIVATSAIPIGAALGLARDLAAATARLPRGTEPPDPPDPPDPPGHPHPHPHPRPRDSLAAHAFRALAPFHLGKFLAPAPAGGPAIVDFDLIATFNQIVALASPRATFAAALGTVLTAAPDAGGAGGSPDNPAPAIPSALSPRFAAPMASALAELGQEWLLPGLEGVPANTALALVTNSSFVQAYMIGLNHEFGRELLWREFPAPLDATFFQRFWDRAVDPEAPPDLEPLAERGDRALDDDATPGDQFVLLLRSELLRRFPDAIVSAKKGSKVVTPVFTGALDPDVSYFGFPIQDSEASEWSVVIAEQPGAPRFGFEIGEAPPGVSHAPAPDANAAELAGRLRRRPAQITIPVRVLMRADPS